MSNEFSISKDLIDLSPRSKLVVAVERSRKREALLLAVGNRREEGIAGRDLQRVALLAMALAVAGRADQRLLIGSSKKIPDGR